MAFAIFEGADRRFLIGCRDGGVSHLGRLLSRVGEEEKGLDWSDVRMMS